jgi:hypothetical protein
MGGGVLLFSVDLNRVERDNTLAGNSRVGQLHEIVTALDLETPLKAFLAPE